MPQRVLYLAAPLFTKEQRARNLSLANALGHFCSVFLPQRDGQLLPDLLERGYAPEFAAIAIHNRDVAAIDACDAVLGLIDGADVDSGTAFELGYADAGGKVCLGYRTDFRPTINPMIFGCLNHYFTSEHELVSWVQDWSRA